jgi:hypothetical protein
MSGRNSGWLVVGLGVLLGLSGCASYPLGMTKAQWEALTPEAQFKAQQQQMQLDQQRAEQRAAEARQRALALEQAQAAQALRRQQAAYGDHVQCVLSEGQAKMGGRWRTVEPIALDLVRGEQVAYTLEHVEKGYVRYSQSVYAGFDGQTLQLCEYDGDYRNQRLCAKVMGTFGDYQRGFSQALSASDYVQGRLRCQFVLKAGYRPALYR